MGNDMAGVIVSSIKVTAQWALKGKQSDDPGYRLLNSSRAVLSADNFDLLLERYEPGTLQNLPQLTVNGFEGKPNSRGHHAAKSPVSYVGIAIHRKQAGQVDVTGRDVVQTSYFCVDYAELSAFGISYSSMYEGFGRIELPLKDHAYITTTLKVTKPRRPSRPTAMLAAALLLTNTPVCVLGADGADVAERLQFIDDVASLLPYGMRSRLSAATWTSSTYSSHNFRLFFSSSDRGKGDHRITWDMNCPESVGDNLVDAYLAWLNKDLYARVMQLSEIKEQIAFSGEQVMPMLVKLGVVPDRRVHWPSGSLPQIADDAPQDGARQTASRSVDELLLDCAASLSGDGPSAVEPYIQRLEEHIHDPLTPPDRRHYRDLIKQHRLLRENLRMGKDTRARFYEVLLRLAFKAPLMYNNYCSVEDCVASERENDWPIHPPLAEVIYALAESRLVQLLALKPMGLARLRSSVHKTAIPPPELIEMIVNPDLQPQHAQFICDIALEHMESRAEVFGRNALRAAFQPYAYLAETLHRIYQNDGPSEFSELTRVIGLIYGPTLGRAAIEDIFRTLDEFGIQPTAALCMIMIDLADQQSHVREVVRRGFVTFIKDPDFSQAAEGRVIARLSDSMPYESGDEEQKGIIRLLISRLRANMFAFIGLMVTLGVVIFVFDKILHK